MRRSPCRLSPRFVLGLVLTLAAAPAALLAQTITPLVLEGDAISGVGTVTTISNLAVNDDGSWLVEVDTNAATDVDSVLVRDGVVELVEGGPIDGPPDIFIDSFDSVVVNNSGHIGFNFFLEGTGAPTGMDSSVHAYLDTASSIAAGTVLVVQEGDTAPDLAPGSTLIGFFDVKINDAGQLLVVASADDPTIPSSVDRALYLWTTDAAMGGVVSSTLIAKEGDILPGQVVGLSDFGTAPQESAVNGVGDVLVNVDIASGDAIYTWSGGVFTELAQEGDSSPLAGRSWTTLSPTSLGLNDAGDTVFRGFLDGDSATNHVIVKNGAVFAQEGTSVPAIGGVFVFTTFGTGPVVVKDGGVVAWYGDWNDPDDTVDTGLFLNDRLVIQEGVTTVGALGTIDTLRGIVDGYQLSDNGRWLIFEAVLDDGTEGAFLVEVGAFFADGFESGDTSAWTFTVP